MERRRAARADWKDGREHPYRGRSRQPEPMIC
jgi:hypothetical protein